MAKVGIIANPASGKDIRRLVARGAVFSNNEKINIVQRVLIGLAWAGVDQVVFMPDTFSIGRRALHTMEDGTDFAYEVQWLEMIIEGRQEDSTKAAALMREEGVDCIITLGGDGTNRVVSKGCGEVPLLPISTGTNNVFPFMMEGTTAGMAAGLVAKGEVELSLAVFRTKRLDILVNGEHRDIALVDAVVYDALFTGSRAIWEVSKLKQIVTTWGEPGNIGMSSIPASLMPVGMTDPHGIYLSMGEGGVIVTAPIAPGTVEKVNISDHGLMNIGDEVEVVFKPSVIALDGEREIVLSKNDRASIKLTDRGPYIIKPREVLADAARSGLFVTES